MNTYDVGLRYQNEVIAHLRVAHGIDARRSAYGQRGSIAGTAPLVITTTNFKKLDLGGITRLAEAAAADAGRIPVGIANRQERPVGDSFTVLRLDDFLVLVALAFPELVSPVPLPLEPVKDTAVVCGGCGNRFEPRNGNQRFCSRAHAARARRARRRDARRHSEAA